MKKELGGVAARIYPLIIEAVRECGCDIWDIDFVKRGADRVLVLTIDTDREEGIGIADCERVTRAIDPILDDADPIDTSYNLEVSSPGIERDITLPRHIGACVGETVEVKLFAPLDGTRKLDGVLLGFEGGQTDPEKPILIAVGERTVALPFESVSKMRTVFDFDNN